MDWKLFIMTFALIFIAELGDKTQLSALALAGSAKTGASSLQGVFWTVFLAASLALILSTLIATIMGIFLHRYIPEFWIKLGSAILFLGMGVFLLYNVLSAPKKNTDKSSCENTQEVLKNVDDENERVEN